MIMCYGDARLPRTFGERATGIFKKAKVVGGILLMYGALSSPGAVGRN